MESQRSKELLQRDHEELCNKMRSAVRVMVEAKETQEALEMKLDQRMHVIHQLQKSQVNQNVISINPIHRSINVARTQELLDKDECFFIQMRK